MNESLTWKYAGYGTMVALLSGAALTPAVLSRGGSPFWAILGWAAMSVLGAVGGCLLVSRHGRPGPAFLVVLGSSMLCRLVVAAAGLAFALQAGDTAMWSFLGGMIAGFLPQQMLEVAWFFRTAAAVTEA